MSGVTGHLDHNDSFTTGGLEITALFTPGHSPGHLSFLIGDCCFTADVLFKDTVGGTMRDSYESLHHSIMDVLMKLPPETHVLPGHTDPTTIGAEWETNPFVRIWRGRTSRGPIRAPSRAGPRRFCSLPATTTGDTRAGCVGRTAPRTSSPAAGCSEPDAGRARKDIT